VDKPGYAQRMAKGGLSDSSIETGDLQSGRVRHNSHSAASRRPVEIGEILSNKYLVEEVIGEGGVGIVVAAHHLELDERVAIKFLRTDVMDDPDVVARFAHEAKAAVAIKSEYVARVFDVGLTASGIPFLVMEYLEGHDLATEIDSTGALPARDAVEYVMQACEALAVAHSKGVIHRDIKPANLFLLRRDAMPVVKVLDFGISKAALTGSVFGGPLPALQGGKLMGTPLYMSPEQIRSTDDVDPQTDIWSLGVVLYELLTGEPAFQASSSNELCAEVLTTDPQSLASRSPQVPAGLVAVVEKCLRRDRAERFQNVAELAIALLPFAPKRARICAERACTTLRAAGMTQAALRVVSTMPPPLSQPMSKPASFRPSGAVARTIVPGDQDAVVVEATRAEPASRHRSRFLLLGGVAATLLVAVTVSLLRVHASPHASSDDVIVTRPSTPQLTQSVGQVVDPGPSTQSAPQSTPTQPPTQGAAPSTAAPLGVERRPVTAPGRVPPAAVAPAKPSRAPHPVVPAPNSQGVPGTAAPQKTTPDEPDLGY
jgi:serine/threonine protein kinase